MSSSGSEWRTAAASDAVLLMLEIMPRLYKDIVNSINDHPATVLPPRTHYRLLGILRHRPGLPLTELARAMGMAKTNASPMVEKLVQAGLVLRVQDAVDRRLWLLSLSPNGSREYENGIASLEAAVAKRFECLEKPDGQALRAALTTLRDTMSRMMRATGQAPDGQQTGDQDNSRA